MKKKNNLLFDNEEIGLWVTFYLNYLNPYFLEENFSLFQKKWLSCWKLFQFWKKKELDKQELDVIIRKLNTTQYSLNFLLKKYKKNPEKIDDNLAMKQLAEIWKSENLTKEDYLARSQKVRNYFLGQMRKQFPHSSVSELMLVIEKFIQQVVGS